MSYSNKQESWIKENNIYPGCKVKITRNTTDDESDSWGGYHWQRNSTKYIGKDAIILEIKSFGIVLKIDNKLSNLYFPYFILEPTKKKKKRVEYNKTWYLLD